MSNRPRNDRYSERCTEGAERNARWAGLSPAQQRKELDTRLGPGVGATRQRRKLLAEEVK